MPPIPKLFQNGHTVHPVSAVPPAPPPPSALTPFWTTADGPSPTVELYHGHAVEVLGRLPAGSVHCVTTSPPYWGLRDYSVCGCRIHTQNGTGGSIPGNSGAVAVRPHARPDCPLCDGTGKVKGMENQLGAEPSPDCGTHGQAQCGRCFVCNMVAVFRGVRRVLRDDGTLWLNLGDTYGAPGLASGNLVGVPWRVALALQADGWYLRQDVIWCLSGGTWLYVRGKKGEGLIQLHDLARDDEWGYANLSDMELWNGERWTKILGVSSSKRKGDELELVLRSGERISCTPNHKFPTKNRGLSEAKDLCVGDKLVRTKLPEPDSVRDCDHMSLDAAWLAGLYIAEGCGVDVGKMSFAGHTKETTRWERVQRVVSSYGGTCHLKVDGNNQTISVYGKVVHALIKELVSGKDAKTKGFSQSVWKYSDAFVEAMMDGYLSGDGGDLWAAPGGKEAGNWSLGFTQNYNLERDIRTACARLGWALIIRPSKTRSQSGKEFPGFWGEIRKRRSGHPNEKDREEIVEIRKSRCREVYDLGVADDPHLFALASGILTHNSKPSPMPESVRNRCTKAHEYVFLLTKGPKYFCDMEAIKEKAGEPHGKGHRKENIDGHTNYAGMGVSPSGMSNKRSVWTVASQGYKGAHYATFPPKLIEPCIKAGTSERGCCGQCGTPWERVVESSKLRRSRPNEYTKRQPGEGLGVGNTCANDVAGVDVRTVGWQPGCTCFGRFEEREAVRAVVVRANPPDHEKKQTSSDTRQSSKRSTMYAPGGVPRARGETLEEPTTVRTYVSDLPLDEHPVVPCVVLDPFVGSGTTCAVSLELGRRSVGIDLSEQYLRENALPRVEGKARALGKLELVSEPERRPVDLSQFWANADADTAAETGGDGEAGAAAEAGADYDLDLDGDLGDGGGGYDLQTEEG